MKRRFVLLLATGFGLGFSPLAPGTAGSLLGVAIVALTWKLHWEWQLCVAAVLTLAAVPLCGAAEHYLGRKDDSRIVADEYMTFPLCMIGLPWLSHMWILPMAFITARILDIIKPPPADRIQSLKGGTGVVMDDVVSSLYALAVNHAVFWLLGS